MSTVAELYVSAFASDVLAGLTADGQKKLPAKYFYDDLGTKLFEAITLLPEYGLTRADCRVLERCSTEVARRAGCSSIVAELGSGTGGKTSRILSKLAGPGLAYYPIDVSREALDACSRELSEYARVEPIQAEYLEGLRELSRRRPAGARLLLLFSGSSIGNFEPRERREFLCRLRAGLRPGDLFLLGADLVKDLDVMLTAYDDPCGVTAAFNLNLLARMNRELDANFDLRTFSHLVLWNHDEERIEMHLVSRKYQHVLLSALNVSVVFEGGETIWTESSHKFTETGLEEMASESGFTVLNQWTDAEWPLIETLWQA